jgi:hypothetical protein
VTNPQADPDRRAWHLAAAAPGPDEDVAVELERSAGRAQARGGMAAAAAFLERSVALTADPARHAGRALAAAQASMQAGAFGKALELLAAAEAGPLDEFPSARVDLLRGQIAFATGQGSDAPPLLLQAAKRLEPLDLSLARETYLNAWMAANVAGRLAGAGSMLDVARAARALPPPKQPPRPLDLLLNGFALLVTDGPAAAAPALRQAASAFASADLPLEEESQFGWMASGAANALWDKDGWRAILVRQVRLTRAAGALEQLPFALASLAMADAWRGDLAAADSLIAEADAVCEATGGDRMARYTALFVAALRGNHAEVAPLVEEASAEAEAEGQGGNAAYAHWVTAILHNGLGRYADALAAAEQATRDAHVYVSMWALPDLIEAAVRTGNVHIAAGALERLAETTQAGGTDFGLGLEARCRALMRKKKPLRTATAKRPSGSAAPGCARTWPAPICSLASGCAGRTAGWTRAPNCAPRTRCWTPSAWRHSPSAPAASCGPPAKPSANARCRPQVRSPRRRPTSPGWRGTAGPTPRSAPSCSSACARSNGTCARCSPSLASAPAGNCTRRCLRHRRIGQPSDRDLAAVDVQDLAGDVRR